MGYDIYFRDAVTQETIKLPFKHFLQGGGRYAINGIDLLEYYITFNYANIYSKYDFSVKDLNGKTALEAIPILERVISELGNETSEDYWTATEGNAKQALIGLLTMAKMRPDAIIEVRY